MGFGAPITNGQVVVVGGQCNFERWCSCSHGLTVGVGPRMMMLTKSRPCPTGCEGGHNGLCAAAYLAKAGKRVCVLERRHILGGAAVTEELVPGFKFSRVSRCHCHCHCHCIDTLCMVRPGRMHLLSESALDPRTRQLAEIP
jgi:hypothetical protein